MTTPLKTRILLADDHEVVRSGLRMVLDSVPDLEVVAEASDGAEAVDRALEDDVDLAVLDVSMPRMTGLQAAAEMTRVWWQYSVAISLVFFFAIIIMWIIIENEYKPEPNQLDSYKDVLPYLQQYEKTQKVHYGEAFIIPTGIFVQSFKFTDPNTPNLTGYIWSKYPKAALNAGIKTGFNFPESFGSINRELAYDIDYGDYRLVGWHFSGAPLYQTFDYRKYPFDRQIVWIRIWAQDFYKNVILVPDFSAYFKTKQPQKVGIENDLAILEFKIQETFFDYSREGLDSNLGIKEFTGHHLFPDLYYNISLKRKFIQGFIQYLLPIIVVWSIQFGLTMVMTSDKSRARAFNFSTTSTLLALGATFFSIVISQINLRSLFAGHPITYIEYFYFITYGIIFFLAINAYLTTPGRRRPLLIGWQDNLLPKVLFWPIILGTITAVTIYTFFIAHKPLF